MAQEQENLNRIMGYFLEEAKDNLRIIEQGLLNLGATVRDAELINEIYRAAHSIKGGSAMLGASSVRKTSHKLEDYFQVLKERPPKIGPKLESLLLQVFDGLTELVENLESSDPDDSVHSRNIQICDSLTPVFKSLDQMMKVENHGANEEIEEPTTIFSSPVVSSPASGGEVEHRSSNLPDPEESAKHLVFKSDIPTLLRQMLQGFKQPDTAESRKQLDQICVKLKASGENFELSIWIELVKLAQGAIANRDNLYADLAPIVIRELKRATDFVLDGKLEQIKPSTALLNLQSEQSLTTGQNDPELDTFLRMGTTPTEAFTMESSSKGDRSKNTQPPLDPPKSYTQRIGPEVGLSELNTLADLFEGETSDLELAWETEISSISPDHPGNPEISEVDDINDFSDFFIDESPQDLPQNATDPLNNNLSTEETYDLELETSEDDLKDLLEIEPSIMSTHPKPTQDSEFSNLFSNPEKTQDLDDLLEINLDSSEDSQSIEELDLEESNLGLTEDEDFELDLDLESPERSEPLSTMDDIFDLKEPEEAEELDQNFENLNQLFDGLSENLESEMDLDALGETEALDDDLSLELEESSSSEELFDLDASSDDGEMDLD
ncbi:Hpt domain-containing protein, partial [Roseofilum sp. BLCC_M154]